MPDQPPPRDRIRLEIVVDPEELRDFFHGRHESLSDIDWAYHLRMGDLRFVEEASLIDPGGPS